MARREKINTGYGKGESRAEYCSMEMADAKKPHFML
jgi:hypothetical protein